MKNGRITTLDNKCFVDRIANNIYEETSCTSCGTAVQKPVKQTPKPERVNLKFGKIRIQITSAKKVKVKQDGDELVIKLEDLSSAVS